MSDLRKTNKEESSLDTNEEKKKNDPGYPPYPKKDDMYNRGKKEEEVDPARLSESKKKKMLDQDRNKRLKGKKMGNDLDVPGSELDDAEEAIGEEDEENNFYSLDSEREENNRDNEE